MRHLPREIIKHILVMTIDIAKKLKRINRWLNNWIEVLVGDRAPYVLDDFWVQLFAGGLMDVRQTENRLRRLRE
jgi:hypothetical protein